MWNENAPLALLNELPAVLNEANLARIQQVIDIDKFVNSSECGYDLCGSYAPFCNGCDKTLKYPCAVAYVKMMQAKGRKVEIEGEQPSPQPESEPAEEEVPAKKLIRIAIAKRKSL